MNGIATSKSHESFADPICAGTFALKETQGLFDNPDRPRVAEKFSCIAMEMQDWIDGINNPEWGRKQIYGPADEPYVLEATINFSVNEALAGSYMR